MIAEFIWREERLYTLKEELVYIRVNFPEDDAKHIVKEITEHLNWMTSNYHYEVVIEFLLKPTQ